MKYQFSSKILWHIGITNIPIVTSLWEEPIYLKIFEINEKSFNVQKPFSKDELTFKKRKDQVMRNYIKFAIAVLVLLRTSSSHSHKVECSEESCSVKDYYKVCDLRNIDFKECSAIGDFKCDLKRPCLPNEAYFHNGELIRCRCPQGFGSVRTCSGGVEKYSPDCFFFPEWWNPCLNGGRCTIWAHQELTYNCICNSGFTGPRCQFKNWSFDIVYKSVLSGYGLSTSALVIFFLFLYLVLLEMSIFWQIALFLRFIGFDFFPIYVQLNISKLFLIMNKSTYLKKNCAVLVFFDLNMR